MKVSEDELKAIGKRLKEIRKTLQLYQQTFAREMNISAGGLSEIETGKSNPQYDVIYNLSEKYKVNIDYLLFGEGEMFHGYEGFEQQILSDKSREDHEFWQEFLYNLKHSRIFRYTFMAYYRKFIIENEELMAKDMARYKEEKQRKQHAAAPYCRTVTGD